MKPEPLILDLTVLLDDYAICRLPADAPMPRWLMEGDFCSVTRTREEISVVCTQRQVPDQVKHEAGWAILKVQGSLAFNLTGILASLAGTLSEAGISLFAISTFDTDYLLVKRAMLSKATEALRQAGHRIVL